MIDEQLKLKIDLLLELAFECGRTYENRWISFDLYNTINFEDLNISKKLGGTITPLKNGNSDTLSNIFGLHLDDRKKNALLEPLEKLLIFKKIILNTNYFS